MGNRLAKAALVYGIAWLGCLVLYWGSLAAGVLGGGGIMGYAILTLYLALPAAGVVAAFLVGRASDLGWRRLVAPVAIAALYVLHTAATFGLSTALGLTNIMSADPATLMYGLVPASIGLAAGWLAAHWSRS